MLNRKRRRRRRRWRTYRHEEARFDWMEEHALDKALALGEGYLRASLGELVYERRTIGALGHDGGQIIAATMPGDLAYRLKVCDDHTHALLLLLGLRIGPLNGRLDALVINDIQAGRFGEQIIRFLDQQLVAHLGIDEQQATAGGHRNNR